MEINDAMGVRWREDLTLRSPTGSYALLTPYQEIFNDTDGSTFSNVLSIPPYTAVMGTTYSVIIDVSLTNKPVIASLGFDI